MTIESELESAEGVYTRAVGAYIAESHKAVLPEDLVERMKLLVLDTLGCGILASRVPWTLPLLATVAATESSGPALIWGHDQHFSPAIAAMVNGTFVHGFETDDVGAGGHVGSVTTTVALALAQGGASLSGLDLIRSMVTGVEVAARVGAVVGGVPHVTNGFHGPGLTGTFAAVATGAYVLDLDAERSVYAIGNAAQFAGGLMGTDKGGMGKRLLMGKAAHSGALAAQLAANGFENVDNIFECGYGSFPSAFSGARDTFDNSKLVEGLGTEYRSYGVNFKMWSCRVPIHPSLEAVKALREERELDAGDIESIDLSVPEGTFKAVGWPYVPTTITAAQMNLQYCLAVMLLDNQVFVDQFSEESIRSPKVLDLVSRIHVHFDPNAGDGAGFLPETVLEITLKSGEKVRSVGKQRTANNNPVTADDVITKFRRVTQNRLPAAAQETLIDLCGRLETLPDTTELLASMQLPG